MRMTWFRNFLNGLRNLRAQNIPPLFCVFLCIWVALLLILYVKECVDYRVATAEEFSLTKCAVVVKGDPNFSGRRISSRVVYGGELYECMWPYELQQYGAPSLGMRCTVSGSVVPLGSARYDKFLKKQGVVGRISCDDLVSKKWPQTLSGVLLKKRSFLVNKVLQSTQSLTGPLIAALVFGYKSRLNNLSLLFKKIGLSHMLAVSGSHFALALGLILVVCKLCHVRKRMLIIISLVFSFCFYVLTGMSVSTLRACLMASMGLLMYFGKRRIDLLSLIGGAGIITLLVDPMSVHTLSFQLSFLAVIGIALYFKPLLFVLRTYFVGIPDFVLQGCAIGLSAQLLTTIVVLLVFHACAPLGIISSLMTTALFEYIIGGGLLYVVFMLVSPGLAQMVLTATSAVASLLLECALSLEDIPGMYIELSVKHASALALIIGAVAALLFAVLGQLRQLATNSSQRKRRIQESRVMTYARRKVITTSVSALLFVCAVLFVGCQSPAVRERLSSRDTADGVYFLNVGQGDATLVKDQGTTTLIDAGPDAFALKAALRALRVAHIDTLIFTHGHEDHVRGADLFNSRTGVRRIIVAQGSEKDEDIVDVAHNTGAPIETVLAGQKIGLPSESLDVVSPQVPVTDSDDNASCLVLALDEPPFESSSPDVVITGDAEAETLEDIVRDRGIKRIGILKLGHHGSRKSMNEEVLSEVSLGSVVISVGKNSYGHPNKAVLDLLNSYHVPYKRTDVSGTIFARSVAQ